MSDVASRSGELTALEQAIAALAGERADEANPAAEVRPLRPAQGPNPAGG